MRQIIALGGGGWAMEPENLSLDQYILDQSAKPRPKVCLLPTARGDAESYILQFYQAFTQLQCEPSFLSLFRLPTADLEGFILEKDIIYVGGGNLRSMLAVWREWDMERILRQAYAAGIVLAGMSAGANCWFEQSTTDSAPGELQPLTCLGLLPGSFSPHYDGEPARRPALHRLLQDGQIKPGFAAEDGAALHFVDEHVWRAVRSRPTARVYEVSIAGSRISETPMEMIDLFHKRPGPPP